MIKNTGIAKFLTMLLLITLLLPAGLASATATEGETGLLTIHKFEQEPGAEQGDGDGSEITDGIVGDALEGVEFTLTQTHSYNPETDKWTPVTSDPKTYVKVTGADGKIVIDKIELGRYTVQETDGPAHVVLNEEEYSVDIPMTSEDGSDVNYNVHVYPKNETVRASVELIKYDGDTESLLSGVTFTLFEEDGTEIESGLKTVDGKITVGNLAYGDYYFQETATIDGYLINGEKVEFSVTTEDAGNTVTVSLANYEKPEVEKDVSNSEVNRGDTVTYTLTIDLPGDINEYDSFKVTDTLHSNLEFVSEVSPDGFTFSQNGQTLTWTGNPSVLEPGTVEITFDAKISEDAVANEEINNEASIDYNNGYEEDWDKSEIPVFVHTGSLIVIKQDGNDNNVKLPGAVFELIDAKGNVVATGTSDTEGVVDFNGETDELNYGDYQLVEKKAPEGYNKLRNPIDVTVNAEHNEQTITVDNYESGWELPKTGGIGSMMFTFIGLMFIGTAGILFFRRKKVA